VGDRYPLGHHGPETLHGPFEWPLMGHPKSFQWASNGQELLESKKSASAHTRETRHLPYMQRARIGGRLI
jgi:hypothetical protein